jgi:prevent-host-death family protein
VTIMSGTSESGRGLACGKIATLTHMTRVASRDLRNHTAEVLRKVSEGAHVTVTVNGIPVAEISPVRGMRRASIPKHDLIVLLARYQADPGLSDDLAALAGETTDDLGPIR